MSKKIAPKVITKTTDDVLMENKYFRTVLLSYYMLTRDKDVLVASEKLKDPKLIVSLFEEYKRYVAGFDIEIENEHSDDTPVFKVPEFTTIKPANILSILKKAPKI
jgi:hypothetical protein